MKEAWKPEHALALVNRIPATRARARQILLSTMKTPRSLASSLARSGVSGLRPSHSDLALDQIGRNDAGDRFMVALAQLAFELALPTEESGLTAFVSPDREESWVRRLFEKAVLASLGLS